MSRHPLIEQLCALLDSPDFLPTSKKPRAEHHAAVRKHLFDLWAQPLVDALMIASLSDDQLRWPRRMILQAVKARPHGESAQRRRMVPRGRILASQILRSGGRGPPAHGRPARSGTAGRLAEPYGAQAAPDGHFKLPHLWPPKLPQAGQWKL